MGQTTMGILWGVRVPDGAVLLDDDFGSGVLDRYEGECRALIKAHDAKVREWCKAKPGRMPWERMDGSSRYVPDWPPDVNVVGFWIAVGASGKPGVPILMKWHQPGYEPIAVSRAGVRESFPKAYRNARARWRRFQKWAAAHPEIAGCSRIATMEPSLWLLPTEVA